MTDSFSMHVFKGFFQKLFECNADGSLRMGFDAEIVVYTSPEMECCGAVGAVGAAGLHNSSNSKGKPGTARWRTGAIGETTTISFYLDVSGPYIHRNRGFLQFQTRYVHPSGHVSLRVTTVAHAYADLVSQETLNGIAYQAAAVLVARQAIEKADAEDPDTTHKWLDHIIICFTSKFSTWEDGQESSFQIRQSFAYFLQILYYLKRCVLTRGANSLDDDAFRRSLMLQASTCHTCQMIQPTLLQYSYLESSPKPVTFAEALQGGDTILVMDSYFQIVYWRAEKVTAWCDAGYHKQEEYTSFNEWLIQTREQAAEFGTGRLIPPRLVCGHNAGIRSIRRAYLSTNYGPPEEETLNSFMEHVVRSTMTRSTA